MRPLDIISLSLGIFGACATLYQIRRWVRGRRADRGLEIFLESQADRKDAETMREEFKQLQQGLGNLKVTARSVAHRMHLEQRKVDLERTLGGSWEEYQEVISELEQPESESVLPSELVDALSSDIGPRYRAEQRERRRTNQLLLILTAALVLPIPFTPSSALYLAGALGAGALFIPAEIGELAYVCGPALTLLGILCGAAIGVLAIRRGKVKFRIRGVRLSVSIMIILILIGNAFFVWEVYQALYWIDSENRHFAIAVNIADCIISILLGCTLILGRILPNYVPIRAVLKGRRGMSEPEVN